MPKDLEILTGIMRAKMLERAEQAGVEPTEVLDKIAAARIRFGLDITECPCAKEDKDRGCISAKCLREIQEQGICHCHCFKSIDRHAQHDFKRSEDGSSKDL